MRAASKEISNTGDTEKLSSVVTPPSRMPESSLRARFLPAPSMLGGGGAPQISQFSVSGVVKSSLNRISGSGVEVGSWVAVGSIDSVSSAGMVEVGNSSVGLGSGVKAGVFVGESVRVNVGSRVCVEVGGVSSV